jgi:hypothetical protein
LYAELSSVRMPAAKHELPKKFGEQAMIADGPGLGLPDKLTGSICWHVLIDGKQTTITRRDLADKFFGLVGWHEDIETALLLAKEAKARRKRSSATAECAINDPVRKGEGIDRFFRTKAEVAHDERPPLGGLRGSSKGQRFRSLPQKLKQAPASAQVPSDLQPYFVRKIGVDLVKNEPRAAAKLRYLRRKNQISSSQEIARQTPIR